MLRWQRGYEADWKKSVTASYKWLAAIGFWEKKGGQAAQER
jgi:hypothetical protein